MRVNHHLLRAGATCKVSNALGVSEKHIQLLGESQAPPFAPGTQRSIGSPCTGAVCAMVWLSSVSFSSFSTSGVHQKRSVSSLRWVRASVSPGSGGSMPPAGVTLASGLGREPLLLALALHPSLLLSPCQAARETEALPPPVSAAV